MTSLYVNADWSALVPAGSVEAAFGITLKDAKRRGLVPLDTGETLGEPEILRSANLTVEPEAEPEAEHATNEPGEAAAIEAEAEPEPEPEPEVKEAAKPANKAARKPRNK